MLDLEWVPVALTHAVTCTLASNIADGIGVVPRVCNATLTSGTKQVRRVPWLAVKRKAIPSCFAVVRACVHVCVRAFVRARVCV